MFYKFILLLTGCVTNSGVMYHCPWSTSHTHISHTVQKSYMLLMMNDKIYYPSWLPPPHLSLKVSSTTTDGPRRVYDTTSRYSLLIQKTTTMSRCCHHHGYQLIQIKFQSLLCIDSDSINIIILYRVGQGVVLVFLLPLPDPSDGMLPQCYGGDYPLPSIINAKKWCSIQQIRILPTPPPPYSPIVD